MTTTEVVEIRFKGNGTGGAPGTAAEWTTANPTLSSGEPGYEKDTHKVKIGDGATPWVSLPYSVLPDLPALLAAKAASIQTVRAVTATSDTFGPSDVGAVVTRLNASASTGLVPAQASVPLAAGSSFEVANIGTAIVTYTPDTGVTFSGGITSVILRPGETVKFTKTAVAGLNTWLVRRQINDWDVLDDRTLAASTGFNVDSIFDDSVFEEYEISLQGVAHSASSVPLRLLLRAAAATITATNYNWQYLNASTSSPSSAQFTGQAYIEVGVTALLELWGKVRILRPQLAVPTLFTSEGGTDRSTPQWRSYSGAYNANTQADGYRLEVASGNISGRIITRGRRKR
ncbi:MAG: hypothetical protein PSX37_12045 [bacterium]|nr:hypothetical protein [bacterium]